MNSKDLRAVEHVRRLTEIGVDSLKIEGRTKSPYYVARTVQVYRRAIDDALAGRPFDPGLLGELEGLANRGYTDGFYQRHHEHEMQNYLRGHSESGRSLYVGDVLAWDAPHQLALIDVKNRFSVGDRLEIIHPSGNHRLTLERMQHIDGNEIRVAPGNGHRVWIPLPSELPGALLARFI
ncbi:MAG: putative protease [Candidatus Accumulibacter phosphatis]|nr:MAG: putative protease [Candidatus Accumulibacter phosphatis]